jgi:hypothetical protein
VADLQIAFVGNSHILTLFEGYQLLGGQLPAGLELTFIAKGQQRIGYAVGSSSGTRRSQPSAGLVSLIDQLDVSDIFVMWLGSQANIRGLLLTGIAFDVVLPTDGYRLIDPNVQLIPCAVVEGVIRKSLEGTPELAEVIKAGRRRGARVWLMAPPHALPEKAVRERLTAESHFAARLAEIGISAGTANILPEPARVRLRELLLTAYREYATDHGAGFCPPPDRLADEEGKLLPRYWGKDITHGSAAYGAAYLQELIEVAGGYGG